MTAKAHDKLLSNIRSYVNVIFHSTGLVSENFFVESTYLNSRNQIQPCYLLTKKDCDMVANEWTN